MTDIDEGKEFTMNKKKATPYLIPLILLVTIVPLIVFIHRFDDGFSQFDWYPKTSEDACDFFMYCKSVAITVIAAVMCVLLAWRYKTKKVEFKFCYEFIPILIYALMTLISSVFSEYRYFSIHGVTEVFETLWVILGYCVIVFYAYQFVNTFDDVECMMRWMTAGLGVMLVIGILQAVGHDFFTSEIGKMVITGGTAASYNIDLTFEKGRVFLTVYNPNYVASYFSLMIPMEIALFIKNKKWQYRVLYAIMMAASLVCLLASGNRSGIVAFAVTLVLTLILFWKYIIKAWKYIVPAVLVAAVIFAVFISKNDLIIEKFVRLFQAPDVTEDAISEIVTGDEDVAITYLGEEFHVSYESTDEGYVNIYITDSDGQNIECTFDEASYTYVVADERFPGFSVQAVNLENAVALGVNADNITWYFKKGDDGTYYYYNVYGRWDKINNAPRVAVNFLERVFEERGTIWSKTIPMLKDSLLFGTGADTYALTYPQDDYVDKTYDGAMTGLDLKPHCFYLQVATQSGMVALIAVLVFYIWYFITSMRLYRKATYQNGLEIIGAGVLLATFTYMIVSVLNDSTVSVAPIYWVLMGIGISVNELVKRNNQLQEKAAQEQAAQNDDFLENVKKTPNDNQVKSIKKSKSTSKKGKR